MGTFDSAMTAKQQEMAKTGLKFGRIVESRTISRSKVIIGQYNHYDTNIAIVSFFHNGNLVTSAMWGNILLRWKHLGDISENNPVGLPVTDELPTPDKVGRFNHFTLGSIYWTPKTGAQFVMGSIRAKWSRMGWEAGDAGYPVTGEIATPAPKDYGRFNHFQGGSIYWAPHTGAQWIPKNIFEVYATERWEQGWLKFPVDPNSEPIGKFHVDVKDLEHTVFFEGGYITRNGKSAPNTVIYHFMDFNELSITKAPFPIEIVYQAMLCKEESDFEQWWSAGSDEPYFMMGAYSANMGKSKPELKKFGTYADVDKNEIHQAEGSEGHRTLIRIEKGETLSAIGISVLGFEHDTGDDTLRGPVGNAARSALERGAEALGALVESQGVPGAKAEAEVHKKVIGEYGMKFIGWAIGKRDDDIDQKTKIINIPELLKNAALPAGGIARTNRYSNISIRLRNSREGDYDLYFLIRKG